MKKAKKPIGYLIFGCIFLFAVLVNTATNEGKGWAAFFWSALSFSMFFVAYKKNKKYRQQIDKESRVFNKLKDFYQSVLDGNDIHQTDSVVSELANSESISEPQIKDIAQNVLKSMINDVVNEETAGGSLSPSGYDNILNTAKKLGVDLKFDPQVDATLARLRQYWSIENEELPAIDTSISLQNGEVCHYQNYCRWLEHRTVTKTVSYAGITGSFKIAKGIRYRVGHTKPQRITTESLTEIDKGNVFLTNKRIIFMGTKKNSNIRYSAVLAVVPYSNAVGIEKDSGKNPVLVCSDPEIMSRILTRLNSE